MKTIYRITLLLILVSNNIYAQNGKLLIIGGGYENITSTSSWNYEAFNWAVSNSNNKKVAFLHYSTTTTSQFENYFINSCGATAAKSFAVSYEDANNQTLINEINEYDVFYLRGGDQWYYYSEWKGTLMEDLIHSKFNEGGVICGTSAGLAMLSGVMYTAEHSSAYSDVCLKNTNHASITLADDFIQVMPGFIFDSHFTERGRMGRLVAFIANWKKNNNETIIGIGVDEITALAVQPDGNATAYGAGTVNIFKLRDGSDFFNESKISIDSIELTSLIQGKTINLNDLSTGGYSESIAPESILHNCPSKIYASGIETLGYANVAMLEEFVNEYSTEEPIIIFTGSDFTSANKFKNKLIELGSGEVNIYRADYSTYDDEDIANEIPLTRKFLFVGNNSYDFMSLFLNANGKAGDSLKSSLINRKLILGFIGDNSRFCGTYIVGNYLSSNANATISEGMNLVKNTAIVPRTFERGNDITNYWNGTNSAIPYVVAKEKLLHGIWLSIENYMIYQGDQGKAKITIKGSSPAMILTQNGSKGELVSQTYSGSGTPDNKAGFDKMYLSFLTDQEEYFLGEYESTVTSTQEYPTKIYTRIYPNPVKDKLFIKSPKDIQLVCIYNIIGTLKFRANYQYNVAEIDIGKLDLTEGVYMVEVRNWDDEIEVQKIIIK